MIIFLLIFGVLMYFIFRPVTARNVEAVEAYTELRDKGDISQEEFEKQKAKLLKE